MMTRVSRHLGAAAALALLVACGGSGLEPSAAGPKTITISTAPSATSTVGTSAGVFAVRVVDTQGAVMSGASVTFTVTGGATVTPSSAVTDANGIAQTTVTLGTLAGPVTVTATVTGTTIKTDALITAAAGAATTINISTSPNATSVVGTSAGIFAVRVVDANANAVPGVSIAFAATGGATVSPTTVTTNAIGIAQTTVTLGTVAGPVTVTAAITGTALNTIASISGINVTCTTLAVGAFATFSGVSAGCVTAPAAGAEYAIITYNSTADGANVLSATITGSGLVAPPSAIKLPITAGASRSLAAAGGLPQRTLVPDEQFHLRMLASDRAEFGGKMAGARAWYALRNAAGGSAAGSARRNAIPVTPVVGQIVSLNVNEGCSSPQYHGARIVAVGTKSIVLADTVNPSGGFTDADYQRFADRFDTVIYPLDTENFGASTDIDGNGRIGIFFTTAVNLLTPANSDSYVGGFFGTRDIFPQTGANACPSSNVGEMFYLLAPDPNGTINQNKRTKGFVDTVTATAIAHELQHLINATRRLYVNTTATEFEVVWLNEGLSHIAQELLYYRDTGRQPRNNLSGADIYTNSRATYPVFKADVISNFALFQTYLSEPGANSPIIEDDELATRGATWSFLRYAVDQVGGSEPAIWTRFDNSTTTGLASLQFALQQSPTGLLRTWALANYLDDLGVVPGTQYQHLSWNYRSIFSTVFGSYDATGTIFTPGGYPLLVSGLADNVAALVSVQGGSASYYRFAVAANRDATLIFSAGGAAPNAALQFNVVRTK